MSQPEIPYLQAQGQPETWIPPARPGARPELETAYWILCFGFLACIAIISFLAFRFYDQPEKNHLNFSLLLAGFLVQGLLLARATKETQPEALDRCLRQESLRLEPYLQSRFRRGLVLDWHFLRHRAQDVFESVDDRLRSFASGALALGLGFTILFLLVNGPNNLVEAAEALADSFADQRPANRQRLIAATQELAQGTLFSLSGSLLGAVVHLLLVLFWMPRVESAFGALQDDFLRWLQEREAKNSPLPLAPSLPPSQTPPPGSDSALQVESLVSGLERAIHARDELDARLTKNVQQRQDELLEQTRSLTQTLQGVAKELASQAESERILLGKIQETLAGLPGQLEKCIREGANAGAGLFGIEVRAQWNQIRPDLEKIFLNRPPQTVRKTPS